MDEIIKVRLKGQDENFDTTLDSGAKKLDDFGKKVGETITRLPQLQRGTVSAGYALNNLNRIVQDGAFGFVAISNNLNPALESLQQLSRQSKEAGVSMGSVLIKELTGAGGLSLALSAVTTALTFAQIGFSNWTRGFESHAEKIKTTKKQIEEFVESLDDVSKVRLTGEQDAQTELVALETLYTASQNLALSYTERKKAVDLLQEKYPAYFKNISDETILAGGAKKAYDQLTTSIVAASRARAAQDTLVDLQKQLLAAEKKTTDALKEEQDAYNKINELRKSGKATYTSLTGEERQTDLLSQITDQQELYNKKIKESAKAKGVELDLQKRINDLAGELTDNIQKNGVKVVDTHTGDVKTDKVKLKPDKIELELPVNDIPLPVPIGFDAATRIHIAALEIKNADTLQDQFAQDLRKVLNLDNIVYKPIVSLKDINLGKDVDKLTQAFKDAGFKLPPVDLTNVLPEDQLKLIKERYEKAFGEMAKEAQFINEQLSPAFTNMFESILDGGNALESFGEAMANQMKKLISELLAQAALAAIISAILPGGGNFLKAFKTLSGDILHFSKGGFVPGSGSGDKVPAMLEPGELVLTVDQAKQFEKAMKGNQLLSSTFSDAVNRAFTSNITNSLQGLNIPSNAFGVTLISRVESPKPDIQTSSAQEMNVKFEGTLKGDDMLLQQKRTSKRQRRNI